MSCEHEVRFTIKPTDDACRFHFDVRAYKDRIVAPDEYSGATEVTPSHTEQVLPTTDKLVRDDITVLPAPTEYLSTDHNGTFTPSDGKVGFYQVDVNVPNLLSGVLDKSISGDLYLDAAFSDTFRYMFNNCNNLRSINLPNMTGKVVVYTINNMANLEEFIAPKATQIDDSACFTNVPKLTKIDIRNVTSIGSFAFRGAPKFTSPVILLKPVKFANNDNCGISAEEIRMCQEPSNIKSTTFRYQNVNVWYLGFSEARATELGFPWGASGLQHVYYDVVFDEEGNIVSIPNT
ncbi:MAG: leucine-rich repeat protein [Clostridiales bacterium]|nr:leucine-rich repeat protein [Clostridiales bacterium]